LGLWRVESHNPNPCFKSFTTKKSQVEKESYSTVRL